MADNDIKAIMVVGAGQMGAGIAQVSAVAGYKVTLNDISAEAVQRGYDGIAASLARSVAKERCTAEERDAALSRIARSVSLDDAKGCDLVIEAATENVALKHEIFEALDKTAPDHAIFATNTSSVPITELAACTGRPSKVIGMHFMNPVPVMKLVEIIRGLETSEDVREVIANVTTRLGKIPVEVRDSPGFVSNRILLPMINEAIYCLYEGIGEPEAIDTVMKLGMNHPMGPLALADLIGLDTCLSIMEVLYEGFADSKYRACPLLRQYVQAGRLGVKSGRGFYAYERA